MTSASARRQSPRRSRLSTTVDATALQRARDLLPGPASRVLDRALLALIDQLESDRERTALLAHPYEDDGDLAWQAPPGSDLPYDGDPPEEVRNSPR